MTTRVRRKSAGETYRDHLARIRRLEALVQGVATEPPGSYEDELRTTGGLSGYWKLDDAINFAATPSGTEAFEDNMDGADSLERHNGVVLDSSGLGNHLAYVVYPSVTPRRNIILASGYSGIASPQSFEWGAVTGGDSQAAAMWRPTFTMAGFTTAIKSVSFWVKTPATGTPQGALLGNFEVNANLGGFGRNQGWLVTLGWAAGNFPGAGPVSTPGRIEVWYANAAGTIFDRVLVGPAVANSTWYHIGITTNGTTNLLYVNGALVSAYTGVGNILAEGWNLSPTPFKIGLFGYKSGFQHLGGFASKVTIDEVAIHTQVVTQSSMQTLAGLGDQTMPVVWVGSDYTAFADSTILASGTYTITLPTAVGVSGEIINVKNVGTGTVTIARPSGETIDGAASNKTLTVSKSEMEFVSDGSGWQVIGDHL